MAQIRRALAGMFRIVCATLCVCGCRALAGNIIWLDPGHRGTDGGTRGQRVSSMKRMEVGIAGVQTYETMIIHINWNELNLSMN